MANTQFLGRATYNLTTAAGVRLVLPAGGLAEQTVTIIFEEVGAGSQLCTEANGTGVVLALPTIAAAAAPFSLSGVRLNAGPLYLVAASGTPSVKVSIVAEN